MKNLKIKLNTYQKSYSSRAALDAATSNLGIFSCGSVAGVSYQGQTKMDGRNNKTLIMYSIGKHRAKKVRNKQGKYVVKQPAKWTLSLTHLPLDLIAFLPKDTSIVQHKSYWSM